MLTFNLESFARMQAWLQFTLTVLWWIDSWFLNGLCVYRLEKVFNLSKEDMMIKKVDPPTGKFV